MNDYCHVNIYYQPITIMVVEIVIVNIICKSVLDFWTPGIKIIWKGRHH